MTLHPPDRSIVLSVGARDRLVPPTRAGPELPGRVTCLWEVRLSRPYRAAFRSAAAASCALQCGHGGLLFHVKQAGAVLVRREDGDSGNQHFV
jgi:hypothetical protein